MEFKSILETRISEDILEISPLSGGDINQVFLVRTSGARYVVKRNSKTRFPNMFLKEARGLTTLSEKGVRTPDVKAVFDDTTDQFLVMEYISQQPVNKEYWENFGRSLSKLHQNSNPNFGLDYNNYIGSLDQVNAEKKVWTTFFIENRVLPMVKMAFDKQALDKVHIRGFDRLFTVFSKLVPEEKPALLHGDLWSGNLLCGKGGSPVFIDPAIYYGHRETDIAMTRMFGGFHPDYLDIYQEEYPLEKGWEKRLSLHNLYPNLVHLVLFGRAYLGGIESVIKNYV
jgi:fructosamine-3-kinase